MQRIYLDNAATAKINKYALEEFISCSEVCYANASALHLDAQRAQAAAEKTREIIAEALGCRPNEIIFTSGATEADNMALIGYAAANTDKGRHIITGVSEHPAVINSCKYLEENGFEISYVPVNECGRTDIADIEAAIRKDTALISFMHVNNETGIINPIENIAALAAERGIPFHTDAVQSFTKLPIDVCKSGISMLSASAHKFGGTKGIGLLYVKEGIRLKPLTHGGAQEEGLRAGTLNIPAIAAMGEAALQMLKIRKQRQARMEQIKKYMTETLCSEKGIRLNTQSESTVYDIMSFSFEGAEPDKLLYSLDINGLSVSAGSACSAGTLEISHVIRAMGSDKYGAPIRISPGLDIGMGEAHKAVKTILEVYRAMIH